MNDKVVTVTFKVWGNSQEEADALSKALGTFVDEQGKQGRKVSADKLIDALGRWKTNILVRSTIDKYFI